MDSTLSRAQQIVRNPRRNSSQKRYASAAKKYEEMLLAAGVNLNNLDRSGCRDKQKDPVTIACAFILQRCGPKEEGYEGLKATSTGGAIKSAVVNFWRSRGVDGEYINLSCGGYAGDPGKSNDLQTLINVLDDAQKTGRCNLTRRAYQETHEDLRKLYYKFFLPQLGCAVRRDPTVNYRTLQAAIANIMQFNAVARGAEMLSLQIRDLVFSGDTVDSPIIGVLPTTKNKKKKYTYFQFAKQVDVSICALRALQGWLCVLRAHGVDDGHVFLQIVSNELQGGTAMDGGGYGRALGEMGEECGIEGLSKHSARRGGAGYHYFVLRRDLFFLYRAFFWESLQEMMKYIGIQYIHNSYALLGFTAFGTNELSTSFVANF